MADWLFGDNKSTRYAAFEAFADYWNFQQQNGHSIFAKLDASQYKDVRLEDLIARPKQVLAEIAEFLEFPESDGWIDDAAAMIDSSEISNSLGDLAQEQQKVLVEACRPGQILLGRDKHPWI